MSILWTLVHFDCGDEGQVVSGGGSGGGFTFAQSQVLEFNLWLPHEDEVWAVYSMCTPLCFCLSLSPHPSRLSFLSLSLPLLLSVRLRQTQTPPHFYIPCETPELTHSSCFSNNQSLPPQSSPIFLLRFLLLLPVYILLCVCKMPFSTVFLSLDLFPHLPQTPVHSLQLHSSSCGHQSGFSRWPFQHCNRMHPKLLWSNIYSIHTTFAITSVVSPSDSPLSPHFFTHQLDWTFLLLISRASLLPFLIPRSSPQSPMTSLVTGPRVVHFNSDVTSNLKSQHPNSLLSHPN